MQPDGARTPDDGELRRRALSKRLALIFGTLLVLLFGFALWNLKSIAHIARNWRDLSEGSAIARELRDPVDLLDYIEDHPDQVSLVAYTLGDEQNGIFLHADQPRPLASTVKLVILCAYAGALERGELRPDEPVSIADWEKYELPYSDGGAHKLSMEQLRSSRYIAGDKVQLQDLVYGMIRFSDNAAADYLMQRLGRERLAQVASSEGLQPPLPFSGLLLSWQGARGRESAAERLAKLRALEPAAYAAHAFGLAEKLRSDAELRASERGRLLEQHGVSLTLREQADFAASLGPQGTARAYAALMARIQRVELPGSDAIRAELQWPMALPAVRERFDGFGTKGGSSPGIMTEASFATPRGGKPRVCALFFSGLPMAVWLELNHNFLHQRFEQTLMFDDVFFERVRSRVGALPAGSSR